MSDLISRQAVIDKMAELQGRASTKAEFKGISKAWKRIKKLPSAQPEIIRCKDCEDYQTDWETSYPNRHYCATMDSMMPEDGFCSYAERRTDE